MITLAKLGVWRRFAGDADGWARMRGHPDDTEMSDDDWRVIDELLLGLALVAGGRASAEYAAALEQRLREATDGPATIEALRALA